MKWILATAFALLPAFESVAAPNDLGVFEGQQFMVQSQLVECKALGTSPPECDAAYTFVIRMRFSRGKIFEETVSFKTSGKNPLGSAKTAKADAGTVYLVGQEIDLVKRPDLASNWRKIEGQEIKKYVVSAKLSGNKLLLSSHRVTTANLDTLGQTYAMDISQTTKGEYELIDGKCKFKPVFNEGQFQMHAVKTGLGLGLLMQNASGKMIFRTKDTICSVQG